MCSFACVRRVSSLSLPVVAAAAAHHDKRRNVPDFFLPAGRSLNVRSAWWRTSLCSDHCTCGAVGVAAGPGPFSEFPDKTSPWKRPAPLPVEAVAGWLELLGEDAFTTDRNLMEEYTFLHTNSAYYPDPPLPQAVAQPRSTEEVAKVLEIANRFKVPVVTYSGGTSLEGHYIFNEGGLCLDTKNLDQIVKVHEEDGEVTLQAAVDWTHLNEVLQPMGLMIGVDPGPGAHVGGMVSTNCSGPHAFRWGMMRQSVVNLTVVLTDGTVVHTRQRPRKTSAGYDLTGLFVGSEGTLGVVTEATLRLQRIPAVIQVATVSFPTVRAAAEAVQDLKQAGLAGLMCCEMLGAHTVHAVNAFSGTSLPEQPLLLLKFSGNSDVSISAEIERARKCCESHTSAPFQFSTTAKERDKLWEARKSCGWAIGALYSSYRLSVTDTAVPLSRIAEYIDLAESELQRSWLTAKCGPNCLLCHLGDGNVHCNFPFDPKDAAQWQEARRLNSLLVKLALSMEGTCTGEHGVGLGKKVYLEQELGAGAIEAMRRVKKAFDPNGILNPGKVLPDA